MTRHVVMFSGGAGSYLAARRVVAEHGHQNVTLLFADTGIEDPDLYRFLDDAERVLKCNLVRLKEGRTPWQVFRDKRFLGNSRVDICSRMLKREPCLKWLEANCDPADTVLYVGIDWTEKHRYDRIVELNKVWTYKAPLCSAPLYSPDQALAEVKKDGIALPRLYAKGFAHNNCGGFCVKAGQAHFANLLQQLPDVYAHHEAEEAALRAYLGKDVSIMLDRRNGSRLPLTMQAFRERKEAGKQHDITEWGGCGCFSGDVPA